ncbi:MAG: PqqD family protein [Gemmatimonadota bacterium]|nr:MAG: PqqD family protein [Gemmatimonadota bacterium]
MFKRRKLKELEAVNLLEIRPVRVAQWEERGDRIVVVRPRPRGRMPGVLLERFFHLLAAQRLRLDEIGSASWLLLDGERSVAEAAATLRERFGERVEPAEERLGHLVRVLHREGFVVYPEWDDNT